MFRFLENYLRSRMNRATADYRAHLVSTRRTAMPLSVELVPSSDPGWTAGPAAGESVKCLESAGFVPAGVYLLGGRSDLQVAGYVDAGGTVIAAVTWVRGTSFLAFNSTARSGATYEVDNRPMGVEPVWAPWQRKVRRPGVGPVALWAEFQSGRPADDWLPVVPEGYAERVGSDYRRYATWYAERGGATREELRVQFAAAGRLPGAGELEGFLDSAREAEADKSLCNWWQLQPDAPVPLETVIDRLVVVHDDLTPELLANAWWCHTGDQGAALEEFRGSPRAAFARVAAARPGRLRRVWSKESPLGADFYLPAEG